MYKVLLKTPNGDKLLHSQIALDATSRLIQPTLTYKVNSVDTFSFSIHNSHPLYNEIIPFKSIIEVLNAETDLPIFHGRALIDTPTFNGNGFMKSILCEDEFAYFNDTLIRPEVFTGTTRGILEHLLHDHNNISGQKQIYLGKCEYNYNHAFITNNDTTMNYILQETVEKYGGELYMSYSDGKRYLNYVQDAGRVNDQPVILGRNLIDLSLKTDYTNVVNKFIPLGKELEDNELKYGENTVKRRVKIHYLNPGFVDYKDYLYDNQSVLEYGEVHGIKIYDDIETPEKLLEEAKKDFVDILKPARTLDITAIDLTRQGFEGYQSWEISDKIRVVCYDIGMDEYFKIVAINFPLDDPESTTYTLGTKYGTATQINYSSAKSSQIIMNNMNEAGNVRADKLNGTVDMLATQLKATLYDQAQLQEPTAILFEDKRQGEPTYGAMALGTLGFMISDEQNPDGSWIWKTFGTGKGFTADLIRAGTLQSYDGTLRIDLGGGTFKTYNDAQFPAIELDSMNMYFYDFKKADKRAGAMFTSYLLNQPDQLGFNVSHYEDYILSISYYDPANDNYSTYMRFDKYKHANQTREPITFWEHIDATWGSSKYYYNNQQIGFIGSNGSNNLRVCFSQDNHKVNFGRQWTSEYETYASIEDYRTTTNHAGFISWQNADFNKDLNVFGNFWVKGTKNCLQQTDNYGEVLVSAYETMSYYFGDLGSGEVGEDGKAFIEIDDIVTECMNTDIPYHVYFTEEVPEMLTDEEYRERSPLRLVKKTPTYFILKGEPNAKFTWEIKAKRRGYENIRASNLQEQGELSQPNNIVDFDIAKQEEPNDSILEDDLEDILLGGV